MSHSQTPSIFIIRLVKIIILGFILASFTGCAYQGIRPNPEFATVRPPIKFNPPKPNGAIFQSESNVSMFETAKAKRIGDILTVVFDENHAAKKESKTEDNKDTSLEAGIPNVLGNVVSSKYLNKLELGVESAAAFASNGKSEQKNSLTGSITVTIVEVLPNNNLVVRGEKLLTLNQGDEYVQLSGIIRSIDVGTDNKVVSSKMANAKIIYSGQGPTHDSNKAGWATRFFMGELWPF
ncbi:MAG: flagellar basal body L-ring protein FlgH [Gammaproteobacteria bacterium]|nr:flagellar basal body L-ring protein FlgH [Gammaproteobacteria bacterium]